MLCKSRHTAHTQHIYKGKTAANDLWKYIKATCRIYESPATNLMCAYVRAKNETRRTYAIDVGEWPRMIANTTHTHACVATVGKSCDTR